MSDWTLYTAKELLLFNNIGRLKYALNGKDSATSLYKGVKYAENLITLQTGRIWKKGTLYRKGYTFMLRLLKLFREALYRE